MKLITKTLAKIAATALFLALCALLPTWVAPSGEVAAEPDPPASSYPITTSERLTDFSARAALFNEKFDFDYNIIDGIDLDSDEIDQKIIEACDKRLDYIRSALTVDMESGEEILSNGINFYTVYDGDGGYIRIMQYYYAWDRDWHNWFTLVMDVDTGELYYLYVSSSCLQNYEKYVESLPYHATFVEFMSAYTGYDLINSSVSFDDDGHTTITCTYGEDGQNAVYTYDINGWGFFNEREPGGLFDYKILCKSDTYSMQQSVENDANS